MNKKNKKICFSFYIITVILLILMSLPNFTILVGLNWFCTESIFIVYLGGVTFINKLYVIIKITGIVMAILLGYIINKILEIETKEHDENLENNDTVIKAYDMYKIDFITYIPYIIDFIISMVSYLYLVKKGLSFIMILVILFGIIEFIVSITLIGNVKNLNKFFKNNNNNLTK